MTDYLYRCNICLYGLQLAFDLSDIYMYEFDIQGQSAYVWRSYNEETGHNMLLNGCKEL